MGFGFEYNLDALTEIEATDSFMEQDEDVRKCQPEPFYNCTTRKYIDALLDQCGCLPLSIRLSDKVLRTRKGIGHRCPVAPLQV